MSPVPQKEKGAFLVWGASSSVGTTVVQIAHSLGYAVGAVDSPKHKTHVKQLGATELFDYDDADVTQKITHSVQSSGLKCGLAYDTISEHGGGPETCTSLGSVGWGQAVCYSSVS